MCPTFMLRIDRRKELFILSTLLSNRQLILHPPPCLLSFPKSTTGTSRWDSRKLSQLDSPLSVAVTVASSCLAEGRYYFKTLLRHIVEAKQAVASKTMT